MSRRNHFLRDRLGCELDDALETDPHVDHAAQPAPAEPTASGGVLQPLANHVLELGWIRKAAATASRHEPLGPESYRLRIGRNERPTTQARIICFRRMESKSCASF